MLIDFASSAIISGFQSFLVISIEILDSSTFGLPEQFLSNIDKGAGISDKCDGIGTCLLVRVGTAVTGAFGLEGGVVIFFKSRGQ